jgi:hypothetical protein
MGEILWRESPVDADLVIDAGLEPRGERLRAGLWHQDDGLIRTATWRTFISPARSCASTACG